MRRFTNRFRRSSERHDLLELGVDRLEDRVNLSGTTIYDTAGNDRIVVNLEIGVATMLVLTEGTNVVTIRGSSGSEISIWGGNGRDVITVIGDVKVRAELGRGDDVYHGRQNLGDVVIEGGEGNDRLNGGSGDDVFVGDGGNDTIVGGRGNDVIYGRDGHDCILGGEGNDSLNGDEGNDRMCGGTGNDHLEGNSGDDRMYGDGGNDSLYGSAGYDRLFGGTGEDVLFGGAHPDRLFGGSGIDTVLSIESGDRISGIELFI